MNRAKKLSDILIRKFKYVDLHSDSIESCVLSFGVNSGMNFSNSKPDSFEFVGELVKVTSWVDLLTKFMNLAYDLNTNTFVDLAVNDYSIPNASNIYITNDKRKLHKSKQIDNSGIYFEVNLSANNIVSFIKDLLVQMSLETDDFSFSLSEVPFDINDENTWAEGMIPVAKLFYNLISDLINNGKITAFEIEELKTKERTKELFMTSKYPAIANSRLDNMGNSTLKRYRAKALIFEGQEIYISTQFYDSDRDAVIEWYKAHI